MSKFTIFLILKKSEILGDLGSLIAKNVKLNFQQTYLDFFAEFLLFLFKNDNYFHFN